MIHITDKFTTNEQQSRLRSVSIFGVRGTLESVMTRQSSLYYCVLLKRGCLGADGSQCRLNGRSVQNKETMRGFRQRDHHKKKSSFENHGDDRKKRICVDRAYCAFNSKLVR